VVRIDVKDNMNSKKAKKLRQLTRVMQDKGVVDKEWKVGGSISHDRPTMDDVVMGTMTSVKQSVLKPECGQAVYKAMKKRAML
jgi:hypothetical protein